MYLPKRRFIPSKWENKKIVALVRAIRNGNFKIKEELPERNYDLWLGTASEVGSKMGPRIEAPKMKLPTHAESYNPPSEYLLSQEEQQKWKEAHPDDRKTNFLPQKYSALRLTPAYPSLMRERFDRCLDLYLAPRAVKKRMQVDPTDLLPQLPSPEELKPFPCRLGREYIGHKSVVTCVDVHSSGQYIVTGSKDCTAKVCVYCRLLVPSCVNPNTLHFLQVWDVMSGRCLHSVIFPSPVRHVTWNPAPSALFYAACSGCSCYIVEPKLAPHQESPLKGVLQQAKAFQSASTSAAKDLVTWTLADDGSSLGLDVLLCIQHKYELKQVSWHAKGDYFTTLNPQSNKTAILVHQLSKFTTQSPFSKNKSDAQSVRFHPTQPILFVALSRRVQVYNLVKQSMVSNLIGGFKQLSCMSVHPSGDHVIIGSHDRRLSWFDLELSNKPYKTVRGREGYRDVKFHLRQPLFCAAAEDGSVVIFHGRVYGDLSSNPLIVPVNKLRAHTNSNHDGAMSACFHPVQVQYFFAVPLSCFSNFEI
jgi:ribosome biogenesis protein ERB1